MVSGGCIWFTGLSGSGKTTTATMLAEALWNLVGNDIVVLDGDQLRKTLSSDLGFSKEDRDEHVRRVGKHAASLVKERGNIVICALISPYRSTREEVRSYFLKDQFIETYMDTSLEVCEKRDVKGLYAKARKGEIKQFTGIDDPYEPPTVPEIVLRGATVPVTFNVTKLLQAIDRFWGKEKWSL